MQISTGVSQWELPTSEAPVGPGSHNATPAQNTNPYNKPVDGLEAAEGTRGVDGPTGDRAGGLGVCNAAHSSTFTLTTNRASL